MLGLFHSLFSNKGTYIGSKWDDCVNKTVCHICEFSIKQTKRQHFWFGRNTHQVIQYQTHNNFLIQPWPRSCWPAHRMGIYFKPLINGLTQHTFKINFLFVEKFPVGFDATFSWWLQVTTMFKKKKIFWKKKKIESDFPLWPPPRQARQAKETSSQWKYIEVTHSRKSGRICGSPARSAEAV